MADLSAITKIFNDRLSIIIARLEFLRRFINSRLILFVSIILLISLVNKSIKYVAIYRRLLRIRSSNMKFRLWVKTFPINIFINLLRKLFLIIPKLIQIKIMLWEIRKIRYFFIIVQNLCGIKFTHPRMEYYLFYTWVWS